MCRFIAIMFLLIAAIDLGSGCRQGTGAEQPAVTLYTSVDEPYVHPIVDEFSRRTGIKVTLLTDTEASKSIGLAERLRAEKDHPQADVWWGNESFLTINLANEGVLAPYDSPAAADIPARYKDPEHRWAGSILRVRMLVSAKSTNGKFPAPRRLIDLLRPEFKKQVAIARPTAGTTGGHVAALYVLWGEPRATQYFRGLHDNGMLLLGGNSVVAEYVAKGQLRAGLCDNDDAADANAESVKVDATLPDQGPGEEGALAMPCAVGLVAGCKHADAARRLIDYLLSPDVDARMEQAHFAWCSARSASNRGHFMDVDYRTVAREMPAAIRKVTAILEGRE